MAVKAINNTVESNRLIPTLLVFGAYLRMMELDPPNLIVKQRATTIKKAIKEVRKIQAFKKVNDALCTRNGPNTTHVYDFYLNNPVLVYKEKKRQKGSYKFLGIDNKTVIILMDNNLLRIFKSTFMRLFKIDNSSIEQEKKSCQKFSHQHQ